MLVTRHGKASSQPFLEHRLIVLWRGNEGGSVTKDRGEEEGAAP